MAEYIERESLVEDIKQYSHARIDNDAIDKMGFQFVEEMCSILRIIEKALTADVVEVVRCKDCEHRKEVPDCQKELYSSSCVACSFHSGLIMDGNDFCSCGEKKEGAEE